MAKLLSLLRPNREKIAQLQTNLPVENAPPHRLRIARLTHARRMENHIAFLPQFSSRTLFFVH